MPRSVCYVRQLFREIWSWEFDPAHTGRFSGAGKYAVLKLPFLFLQFYLDLVWPLLKEPFFSSNFILIWFDLCLWHGFGHWHWLWWLCKTNLLWYPFQILPASNLFVSSKQSLGSLIQPNMMGNVVWSKKIGFTSESVASMAFDDSFKKFDPDRFGLVGNVVGCNKKQERWKRRGFTSAVVPGLFLSPFYYLYPKRWFLGNFLKTSIQTHAEERGQQMKKVEIHLLCQKYILYYYWTTFFQTVLWT